MRRGVFGLSMQFQGRTTTLQSGDEVGYAEANMCFFFTRSSRPLRTPSGDDKWRIEGAGRAGLNEETAWSVMALIAVTHGFDLKEIDGRSNLWARLI